MREGGTEREGGRAGERERGGKGGRERERRGGREFPSREGTWERDQTRGREKWRERERGRLSSSRLFSRRKQFPSRGDAMREEREERGREGGKEGRREREEGRAGEGVDDAPRPAPPRWSLGSSLSLSLWGLKPVEAEWILFYLFPVLATNKGNFS